MVTKRATRHRCNSTAPVSTLVKQDKQIISEYDRGTRWAGWLFVGFFAFLTLGAVMFGW